MSSTQTASAAERAVRRLSATYGFDPTEVPIINGEPWLNSKQLIRIARASGDFTSIGEGFDQFIPALNQIVHIGTVIDRDGRSYARSGVATIGEQLQAGDLSRSGVITGGIDVDPHELAAARALRKALDDAGFDPLAPGSRVPAAALPTTQEVAEALGATTLVPGVQPAPDPSATATAARLCALRQIHMLAAECGLIVGTDSSKYRDWLTEYFGTNSVAGMTETERASVINALGQRLA
jgi:hypothetical protein